MIKIFFLILQLNYSVTLGYVPYNSISIYETESTGDMIEMFAALETEVIFNDLVFLGGKVETSFYAKAINEYIPYHLDFTFNAGIRYKLLEIGFMHRCTHPMFIYAWRYEGQLPYINYEGGYERVYIRFSNKE